MIWTVIYENQTSRVFSTQFNSYEEAKTKAGKLSDFSPVFALIKGNHAEVRFFEGTKKI
jgi:hypothetical protein